jgi:cyanophycinase-like exopeptidase
VKEKETVLSNNTRIKELSLEFIEQSHLDFHFDKKKWMKRLLSVCKLAFS